MRDLIKRLEAIGGCGDGNCKVFVRPGMHTNGGCRCLNDRIKAEQVVYAYRTALLAGPPEPSEDRVSLTIRGVIGAHIIDQMQARAAAQAVLRLFEGGE